MHLCSVIHPEGIESSNPISRSLKCCPGERDTHNNRITLHRAQLEREDRNRTKKERKRIKIEEETEWERERKVDVVMKGERRGKRGVTVGEVMKEKETREVWFGGREVRRRRRGGRIGRE